MEAAIIILLPEQTDPFKSAKMAMHPTTIPPSLEDAFIYLYKVKFKLKCYYIIILMDFNTYLVKDFNKVLSRCPRME